jgi:hypothetical protein
MSPRPPEIAEDKMRRSTTGRTKQAVRLLVAAIFAAGLVAGGTVAARAFDIAQIGHFVTCFGLMLTAPDEHSSQCLPSNVPPEFGSLAGGAPSCTEDSYYCYGLPDDDFPDTLPDFDDGTSDGT